MQTDIRASYTPGAVRLAFHHRTPLRRNRVHPNLGWTLAFADFIAGGQFDRHLRRMRPRYRLPDLGPAG